jgi:hypothetical protein
LIYPSDYTGLCITSFYRYHEPADLHFAARAISAFYFFNHDDMKRKNSHQQEALIAPTQRTSSFLRTGRRIGLGLLLSGMLLAGSSSMAGAQQMIKSYDYQSAGVDLRGYVISCVDANSIDEGTVAAGNYDQGNGMHFQVTDSHGGIISSTVYKFPDENDVRVVSVITKEPHQYLVTLQARKSGMEGHAITLLLDDNGNINGQYHLIVAPDYGTELFPMHSAVIDQTLYICGYVSNGATYPGDPRYTDDRTAFVGMIDLNTHHTDMHYYYSSLNTNTVTTPGWNFLYNDYDAAMRLRVFDNRLFVMGSANGSATLGTSTSTINSSKAWISELDPSTLDAWSTTYYGPNSIPANTTPSALNGVYALDLIVDLQTGGYFGMTNDFIDQTWKLTHLQNTLAVSTPFSGSNSIAYNSPGQKIKGSGIYNWNNVPGRISLYGTLGSDVPLDNPPAWGSTIANTSQGGIPYLMGVTVNYSAVTGMTYNSEKGHVLGNQPIFAAGLNYQEPFNTAGSMGEWCNPAFGLKAYPYGGDDDVVLMGHYLNLGTSGPNPRYIYANGEGAVNGCAAAERMQFGLGTTTLSAAAVTGSNQYGDARYLDYQVDMNPMDVDAIYDCEFDFIYRTAKPAAMANNTKGLYPNPATDQVTIMLGAEVADGDLVTFTLTDMTGRVVLHQQLTAAGNSLPVKLPRLTAGMYQAGVRINQSVPAVYKLVIQ